MRWHACIDVGGASLIHHDGEFCPHEALGISPDNDSWFDTFTAAKQGALQMLRVERAEILEHIHSVKTQKRSDWDQVGPQ